MACFYGRNSLFSLSIKCGEYVRKGKKYKSAVLTVNFSNINRAIEKLNRKEVEVEAVLDVANCKV